MNKRQIGRIGEDKAAAYLTERGYQILEQNYRCRLGEIDLIAKDGRFLVFIEVKYRTSQRYGDPAEAVDSKKQFKIYQTARYYLYQQGYSQDQPCRFDVAAVYGNGRIRYIKYAFGNE